MTIDSMDADDLEVVVSKRGVASVEALRDATIRACVDQLGDDTPRAWRHGKRGSMILQFFDAQERCYMAVKDDADSFDLVRGAKRLLAIPVPASGAGSSRR